jgi:hypothetical protein
MNNQPIDKRKQQFLRRRTRMFVFGLIGLLILAAWTLSAFWEHIDRLQTSYGWAAKLGALFGEIVLIDMLWCYCFDKSLRVRREALIFGFLLTVILAAHAGVLRGMHSIEQRQTETETRLKDTLTEMSKEQMTTIKGASDDELNPRTRRAANAEANRAKAEIARQAQEQVGEEIKRRDQKIISETLAPTWYINGWMYALIFLVASAFAARVNWLHIHVTPQDLDEDYDSVPDYLKKSQLVMPLFKPGYVYRGGQIVNGPDRNSPASHSSGNSSHP